MAKRRTVVRPVKRKSKAKPAAAAAKKVKRRSPAAKRPSPRRAVPKKAAAPKQQKIKHQNYKDLYNMYFTTYIEPLLQNIPNIKAEMDRRIQIAGGENQLYQIVLERSLPAFRKLTGPVIQNLGPERILSLLSAPLPTVFA